MDEIPFEIINSFTPDISLVTSKTEVYATSSDTIEYTVYQTYYIAWLQYMYIFSIVMICALLILLFVKKNK